MSELPNGEGVEDVPKLLCARAPECLEEERKIRRLAGSRHAASGRLDHRARIISLSWQGLRTAKIAEKLGCHPKIVRTRIYRFNIEGIDRIGDRPGAGRKPASPKTSAAESSLWSLKTRQDGFAAMITYHRKLLMRPRPPIGPWTPWLRQRKRWVSRSAAASSGASCCVKGCADGTPGRGPRARTRSSSQKVEDRRFVH